MTQQSWQWWLACPLCWSLSSSSSSCICSGEPQYSETFSYSFSTKRAHIDSSFKKLHKDKDISYKQSTGEPANTCTVIIEQMRESVQKAPFIRKPTTAAGGHRTELSSYHGNYWLFVPLCCGRFKKYKQAGSHSNSFRLTNGRADDTGRNKRQWLF